MANWQRFCDFQDRFAYLLTEMGQAVPTEEDFNKADLVIFYGHIFSLAPNNRSKKPRSKFIFSTSDLCQFPKRCNCKTKRFQMFVLYKCPNCFTMIQWTYLVVSQFCYNFEIRNSFTKIFSQLQDSDGTLKFEEWAAWPLNAWDGWSRSEFMLNTYIQNYSNAEIQKSTSTAMQITNYKFAKLSGLGTKFKLNIHKYTIFQVYRSQIKWVIYFQCYRSFGKQVGHPQMSEILSVDKS